MLCLLCLLWVLDMATFQAAAHSGHLACSCCACCAVPAVQVVSKSGATIDDSEMIEGLVLDHKAGGCSSVPAGGWVWMVVLGTEMPCAGCWHHNAGGGWAWLPGGVCPSGSAACCHLLPVLRLVQPPQLTLPPPARPPAACPVVQPRARGAPPGWRAPRWR